MADLKQQLRSKFSSVAQLEKNKEAAKRAIGEQILNARTYMQLLFVNNNNKIIIALKLIPN